MTILREKLIVLCKKRRKNRHLTKSQVRYLPPKTTFKGTKWSKKKSRMMRGLMDRRERSRKKRKKSLSRKGC
jgi:hypothetical protein